jgi:hypothetical protein
MKILPRPDLHASTDAFELFAERMNKMDTQVPSWFERFTDQISWDEFNQNFHIDLVNKYVYVETPKAACSTVKSRLLKTITRGLPVPKEIHPTLYGSPFVRPYQLPDRMMDEILFGDDFFRFSFVREPLERVLSAYLDKIRRPMPQRDRLLKRFFPEVGSDYEPTFGEFVDCLGKIKSVKNFDKHWRPQCDLLFVKHITYHHIGCMARFEEDWAKVVGDLQLNIPLEGEKSILWHATSAKEKLDTYMTSGIRDALIAIYEDDIAFYTRIMKEN